MYSFDSIYNTGHYFLAMIIMVVLSVVFTVIVINVSARSTPVPVWVRFIVLKLLARVTRQYRADIDKDLSKINKNLQNEMSNSLRFANVDAVSDDEPEPLKVNGVTPEEASIATTKMGKISDDVTFIRLGLESKTMDEFKVSQWKHVATVIDKCLLLGFLIYAVITSYVLIGRALGPVHVQDPLNNSTA